MPTLPVNSDRPSKIDPRFGAVVYPGCKVQLGSTGATAVPAKTGCTIEILICDEHAPTAPEKHRATQIAIDYMIRAARPKSVLLMYAEAKNEVNESWAETVAGTKRGALDHPGEFTGFESALEFPA